MVEVGLVPVQLTAYDAAWVKVNEISAIIETAC
jgi:hypothetical protein